MSREADSTDGQRWRLVVSDSNKNSDENAIFTTYPVPFDNLLTILGKKETKNKMVRIADISGKILYEKFFSSISPDNEILISTTSWSSGMYFLSLSSNNEQIIQKIFKM